MGEEAGEGEEEEEEEEEEVDQGVEQEAGLKDTTCETAQESEKGRVALESASSTSDTVTSSAVSATPTPATPATPISTFSSPIKKEVAGQSSVESWNWERRRSSRRVKRPSIHSAGSRKWSNASSWSESLQSSDPSLRRDVTGMVSMLAKKAVMEPEEEPVRWGLDQIELSDTDSDLEFFDAKGIRSPC